MKKIFTIALLCISITSLFSQTDSTKFKLTSKRGFYYFPEKGDWSIGVNASPFFKYISGLIGDNNYTYYSTYYDDDFTFSMPDEAPSFAFTAQNPGTIYLKYFNTDNSAYRFKILFGYSSNKDKLGNGTDENDKSYLKQTALNIGLYIGQQFYMPVKSRIRGYCGYEVGVFSRPYTGPSQVDANLIVTGKVELSSDNDFLDDFTEKGGNTFGASGAALLGVEWFFAPKVSLGGELGLGAQFSSTSKRKYSDDFNDIIVDSGENNVSIAPFISGDLVLHIYF